MNADMTRLVSEAKTVRQAAELARLIASEVQTWEDAAELCGRLFVQEMLPEDETMGDQIGANSRVRQRIQGVLISDWRKHTQEAILTEAADSAAKYVASEVTKAGLSIGTSRENAKRAILFHLCRALGYESLPH